MPSVKVEPVMDLDLGQWQEKKVLALRPRVHTRCRVCKGVLEASQQAVMAAAGGRGRVRCGLSRGARTEIGDLWILVKPKSASPCQWESMVFSHTSHDVRLWSGTWCLPDVLQRIL